MWPTAAAGGAWALRWLLAQRRVEADRSLLDDPPRGRPLAVRSADGTLLHAEEFGPPEAPTIVLAHGWTCAVEFWAFQIRDLAERFRVVAYDQRGHARSGRAATGDYSVAALAADLDAVLRTCVPEGGRPLVVGHSLGGMSIVAWAGLHAAEVPRRGAEEPAGGQAAPPGGRSRLGEVAERVAGAVLIDTGAEELVRDTLVLPLAAAIAPRLTGRIGARAIRTAVPLPRVHRALSEPIVRWIALNPNADRAVVRFTERLVLGTPMDVRAAFGGTVAGLSIAASVERLTVPTVVIVGALDRLTPPSHSRRIADRLPAGELVELPGIGHMAPLEAPDEVTANIAALADRVLARDESSP